MADFSQGSEVISNLLVPISIAYEIYETLKPSQGRLIQSSDERGK